MLQTLQSTVIIRLLNRKDGQQHIASTLKRSLFATQDFFLWAENFEGIFKDFLGIFRDS